MQVTFYNFSKRRNSTKQPAGGTSYSCTLKDATSTARPSIALKWDGGGGPMAYNYCYIADFGRYYWVNSWTFSERQWIADCVVDVLATYKSAIGSSSKYILRSASKSDPGIIDTLYTPKLSGITPYNSGTVLGFDDWATSLSGGTIVIGIIGMDDSLTYSAAGVSYYSCSPASYMTFLSDMYTESLVNINGENYGSTFGDAFKAFSRNILRSVTNPTQYIKSAMWYPFSFTTGTPIHPVVGGITSTATFNTISNPIKEQTVTFTVGGYSTNANFQRWKGVEPFRQITAFLPPYGTFRIDAAKLDSRDLQAYVKTDAISGQSHLLLLGTAHGGLDTLQPTFASTICQVGVPMDHSGLLTPQASISTAISAAASMYSGDVVGAAAGVANLLANSAPVAESRGNFGGIAGDTAPKYVEWVQYEPIDEDIAEKGQPLCQTVTISTLSGYVLCMDGEVECNATEAEHLQLEAFLTGGFFYE